MSLEQLSIVGVLAPVDSNGAAKNSQCINAGKFNRLVFLVYIGNLAGDITLTVEECTAAAGTGNTAKAFNYYKASAGAAAKSILDGARAAATSAGITLANATDDNKILAIDIDPAELTEGYPYVRIATTNPGAAGLLAEVALGEPRYQAAPDSQVDPTT